MRKRDVRKLTYGLVFTLTLLVFLFGLLLGNYLTERKMETVREIEDNLRVQTAGAELQYLLLLQEPCKYINSTPLTQELYDISEKVDYMETQRGSTDSGVQRLKNQYSILQIRHWLFTLRTNEQCELNQIPVIYFYSNEDCPRCKEQGYTLTYLRKKYPDMRVYAFDIATENPALDTVKNIHDLNETPTLIFPEHRFGFMGVEELETLIVEEYNLTQK